MREAQPMEMEMDDDLYSLSQREEKKMIAVVMLISFCAVSYLGFEVYQKHMIEPDPQTVEATGQTKYNVFSNGFSRE